MSSTKYILLTAARNEEEFIEKPLQSVIAQSIKPIQWIIVSDGSTDKTDQIIMSYTEKYNFIKLIKISGDKSRNFGSKAKAIMYAYNSIENADFDFVGNVDADISFERNYYEKLFEKFENNDKLGIAGGIRYDFCDDKFILVHCAKNSVGGPFQMFRKKCFEDVQGYSSLKYGGIDAAAEITARFLGWEVQSFDDLTLFHYRCTGSARGKLLKSCIIDGYKLYHLGYHPLFFSLKMSSNILRKPILVRYLLNLYGYFSLFIKGDSTSLSKGISNYLKSEQKDRLLELIKFRKSSK
jgi:glycosyltransferase involved in cell wall biosynthesis